MKIASTGNFIYQNSAVYYSGLKNTTTQPAFRGAEQITRYKQAQFQKFFGSNPNFAKLGDYETLKQLNIFKRFTTWEITRFKDQVIGDMFDQGIRDFFSTINGKKPAARITTDRNMHFMGKIKAPQPMDIIYLNTEYDNLLARKYTMYVFNKEEVMKIIGENKELYTKRLKISPDSTDEKTYEVLKASLKNTANANHDLIGITLGYPVKSSLIYNLEKQAKMDYTMRKDVPAYKKKLLNFCKSEKNPYKNMSKNFQAQLVQSIKDINNIESYTNGIYSFIKFVDEPKEIKRINDASASYIRDFHLDLMPMA